VGGSQFVFCDADEFAVREFTLTHTGTDARTYFYPSGNGPVTILGQVNLINQPGVRVHRAANGAWGVSAFLQRNATFDQQLQLWGTDLIIIMLGQNDMALGRPEYRVRVTQLAQRLQSTVPDAEIVLVSTYDSGSNQLPLLAAGMFDAASELGLGFINLNEYGDRQAEHAAAGRIDPDGVHFLAPGGRYVANFVFDALHTNGASIVAPCSDVDFNNDGLFPSDQDIVDLLTVLAGGICSTAKGPGGNQGQGCDEIDFDRNGFFPDDNDILAFLRVLAGGDC
jgi:lysophospholipase L1-like esterase